MRIILDVDCVVADFVGQVMSLVGRPTERHEANEWDWFDNYPDKERILVRDALSKREFWETLPLIQNAIHGVNFLRENGHEIIWCSAPYKFCPVWLDARFKWLETHFRRSALEEPIVPTKYKYLVGALAMIDDSPGWVDHWQEENPKGIGFVFKTELNRHLNRETVNWQDIMNMKFFKKGNS